MMPYTETCLHWVSRIKVAGILYHVTQMAKDGTLTCYRINSDGVWNDRNKPYYFGYSDNVMIPTKL